MIGSLIRGLTLATVNWKMVLVLLAANIAFALPVAVPIFTLILQTAAGRTAADSMMADKLDVDWTTDVINLQMPGSSFDSAGIQTGVLLAVAAFSYLLFTTLLTGGILSVFTTESGRFTVRDFWAGCGANFWRFFRLMLISLFFYAAAIAVYAVIHRRIGRLDAVATAYETVVYKRWAGLGLLLLMFWIVNMIFDYARIMTVVNDSRRMIRQTLSAVRFVLRHPLKTFALYLAIVLIGMAVFALLLRLRGSLDQSSITAVLLAILIGQLTLASRMWARVASCAGQMELYRRLAPPVIEAPPATDIPTEEEVGSDQPSEPVQTVPYEDSENNT